MVKVENDRLPGRVPSSGNAALVNTFLVFIFITVL